MHNPIPARRPVRATLCVMMLGFVALWLAGCGARSAEDQSFDRLERAIVAVERAVEVCRGAPVAELDAARTALDSAGAELQAAFTQARAIDEGTLDVAQAERRRTLEERAVAAVADLIQVRLAPGRS